MKRIGILSDTHSCWDDRFAIYFADCNEIWHAGDVGDISVITQLNNICPTVRAVCGNIDHGQVCRVCPEIQEFKCEDINVWMSHIAGYPGKYSPGVKKLLRDKAINLMITGHSHILKVIYDQDLNLLHINPGAAGYHGWQKERTLIKLTIDGADMRDLEVIELGRHRMETSRQDKMLFD